MRSKDTTLFFRFPTIASALGALIGYAVNGVTGALIVLLALLSFEMLTLLQLLSIRARGPIVRAFLKHRSDKESLIERSDRTTLCTLVKELACAAGLPVPAVYEGSLRKGFGFAVCVAKHDAAIIVDKKFRKKIGRDRLRALLAHELGHIADNSGFEVLFARFSAGIIFGCILAFGVFLVPGLTAGQRVAIVFGTAICRNLLLSGLSRINEFQADRFAADLLQSAQPMIDLLRFIHKPKRKRNSKIPMDRSAWNVVWWLFATHPSIGSRIRRLQRWTAQAS